MNSNIKSNGGNQSDVELLIKKYKVGNDVFGKKAGVSPLMNKAENVKRKVKSNSRGGVKEEKQVEVKSLFKYVVKDWKTWNSKDDKSKKVSSPQVSPKKEKQVEEGNVEKNRNLMRHVWIEKWMGEYSTVGEHMMDIDERQGKAKKLANMYARYVLEQAEGIGERVKNRKINANTEDGILQEMEKNYEEESSNYPVKEWKLFFKEYEGYLEEGEIKKKILNLEVVLRGGFNEEWEPVDLSEKRKKEASQANPEGSGSPREKRNGWENRGMSMVVNPEDLKKKFEGMKKEEEGETLEGSKSPKGGRGGLVRRVMSGILPQKDLEEAFKGMEKEGNGEKKKGRKVELKSGEISSENLRRRFEVENTINEGGALRQFAIKRDATRTWRNGGGAISNLNIPGVVVPEVKLKTGEEVTNVGVGEEKKEEGKLHKVQSEPVLPTEEKVEVEKRKGGSEIVRPSNKARENDNSVFGVAKDITAKTGYGSVPVPVGGWIVEERRGTEWNNQAFIERSFEKEIAQVELLMNDEFKKHFLNSVIGSFVQEVIAPINDYVGEVLENKTMKPEEQMNALSNGVKEFFGEVDVESLLELVLPNLALISFELSEAILRMVGYAYGGEKALKEAVKVVKKIDDLNVKSEKLNTTGEAEKLKLIFLGSCINGLRDIVLSGFVGDASVLIEEMRAYCVKLKEKIGKGDLSGGKVEPAGKERGYDFIPTIDLDLDLGEIEFVKIKDSKLTELIRDSESGEFLRFAMGVVNDLSDKETNKGLVGSVLVGANKLAKDIKQVAEQCYSLMWVILRVRMTKMDMNLTGLGDRIWEVSEKLKKITEEKKSEREITSQYAAPRQVILDLNKEFQCMMEEVADVWNRALEVRAVLRYAKKFGKEINSEKIMKQGHKKILKVVNEIMFRIRLAEIEGILVMAGEDVTSDNVIYWERLKRNSANNEQLKEFIEAYEEYWNVYLKNEENTSEINKALEASN